MQIQPQHQSTYMHVGVSYLILMFDMLFPTARSLRANKLKFCMRVCIMCRCVQLALGTQMVSIVKTFDIYIAKLNKLQKNEFVILSIVP